MSPFNSLIVFLKAPIPGQVKTRLAPALGPAGAAAAYRQMVDQLLKNLYALPNVQLRFAPDHAFEAISGWLQKSWCALPQGAGDLGTRLTRAFAQAFERSAHPVIVIGSDCPTVSASDIHLAAAKLRDHDLVLGPATDGGYWLIGMRQFQPSILSDIPWSTSDVLTQTLARIQSASLSVSLLREQSDIDTIDAWTAWQQSLLICKG